MQTTVLFVELLIVGVQTALWMFLLPTAIWCDEWINDIVPDIDLADLVLLASLPVVALTYTIGVITDRLVDSLSDSLDPYFPGIRGPFKAELDKIGGVTLVGYRIVHRSPGLESVYNYYRGRIRVARAFAFNALPIGVSATLWTWLQSESDALGLTTFAVGLIGCVVFIAAWIAFTKLNRDYHQRLVQMNKVIEEHAVHGNADT